MGGREDRWSVNMEASVISVIADIAYGLPEDEMR